MQDCKIGFIGAGQMARALARGFVEANLVKAQQVYAADAIPAAVEAFTGVTPGTQSAPNNNALVENCDIVFLAVKPQHLMAVTDSLTASSEGTLFVSIIAGATLSTLSSSLGSERVIRVMPNTPCLIGKGAAAFCCGSGATSSDRETVHTLMSAVGYVTELAEPLLDAVTGLSGSGPAFVFQMIEALSDGGVRMGLPRNVATELAAHTVAGAAAMVNETGEHPAILKDRVASPGGTTIAGIKALEQGGLRAALISAVEAASQRSRELGAS